jgi:excisionase family DNA binding protein
MLRKTSEAAKRLNFSASTLEKMRITGRGPRFIRMGRIVRYDDDDLDAYVKAGCSTRTYENVRGE